MKLAVLTFFGALWASFAASQTLNFPSNATLLRETSSAVDSYAMPIGPWVAGGLPVKTEEGHLTQQAWRISATGLTSLQLVRPVREQLRNDGFEILFECKDQACGGFDFRFSTPVLPPPDMQVNLGDFRYLAASRDTDEGAEIISIIASRSANAGFVQVTRVGAAAETVSEATAQTLRASPHPCRQQILRRHFQKLDTPFYQGSRSKRGLRNWLMVRLTRCKLWPIISPRNPI
jgi:hypothetical protein